MTGNEAQKWLERFEWDDSEETSEALATICEALQEYPKFKAIGRTPTQIYEKIGGLDVELGKFHAIGTIEEFKALKEKSVAKKPTNIYRLLEEVGFCPSCRLRVYNDKTNYCHTCGQKLDWK